MSAKAPAPARKTLYERLGGRVVIKLIVDTFISHVVSDKRNTKFSAKANFPHIKLWLVEQISASTGGPVNTLKDKETTHHDADTSDRAFGKVVGLVENLIKALNDYKIPQSEQKELIGILGQ